MRRSGLLRAIPSRLLETRIPEHSLYLALALIIGALVGLLVVAFILLTEHLGSQLYPPGSSGWRRLVAPVLGSLLTGFLLARYFPAARGSGIPQTKVAMQLEGGIISVRTVVGRFICSCGALASGIALGREGPSVQIGGGVASILGQRLGLKQAKLSSLIPVGAAAAVSAAFNTPIAGVLFSLEEVVGDLHAPVLGSAVLASATAWVTLHLLLGGEPLFHVPQYELVHPLEFLIYALLGVAGGICSLAFVKLTIYLRAQFLKLPDRTRWIHPVFGGLVVGLLGLWSPAVLGVGYDYVGQVLNGDFALGFVLTLLTLKLIASAACYGSGNAGGIFGPSLFLGAMCGAGVGSLAHRFLPGITANPGAYALVGMGALFAGIIRAPFTSVFMIFELTRDYAIVVPLMIANMVSLAISRNFQRIPIYEALALQDGIHLPRHSRERDESGPFVADIMYTEPAILPASTLVADAVIRGPAIAVAAGRHSVAAFSRSELEDAAEFGMQSEPLDTLVEMREENPHLHADHLIEEALEKLQEAGVEAAPVVDRSDISVVRGVVTLAAVRQSFGVGKAKA